MDGLRYCGEQPSPATDCNSIYRGKFRGSLITTVPASMSYSTGPPPIEWNDQVSWWIQGAEASDRGRRWCRDMAVATDKVRAAIHDIFASESGGLTVKLQLTLCANSVGARTQKDHFVASNQLLRRPRAPL